MRLIKTNKTMRQFKDFKQAMIETLQEMDEDGFNQEGDYLYQDEIQQIKSTDNFTDLSKILVDMEYWDQSDAIRYSKQITEK